MAKKMGHKDFVEKVFQLSGDEYTVLGKYINSRTKITFKHNTCGSTFEMSPSHFVRGQRCIQCNKNIKKTTAVFKKNVYDLVVDEYNVLGEYKNIKTKIKMKHNVCGHEFEVLPKNFLYNDNRCPNCRYTRSSETLRMKDFEERVYSLVSNEYEVLGNYVDTHTPILIKHNSAECQYNEFLMRPNDFLNGGHRCPVCSKLKKDMNQFLTDADFQKKVYAVVGDEYTFLEEYIASKTKISVRHNECNHEYTVAPNHFLNQGNRCPHCFYLGVSRSEKDVLAYIKTFYTGEILENYKLKNNKEVDIYIPDKKIGIEFDGLYWHSEERGKDKKYHLDKTNTAFAQDIRLIHIFEDEWENNRVIVKSKLKHILGFNTNPRIYARKCTIKEIDPKTKNSFLEDNHIQGLDRSKIKLGLFHNEILVSVMTFGKKRAALGNRVNTESDFELVRFANDINYIVIGSFGKLLKYFERNYEYNSIITYADLRWSSLENNVYKKNKFIKSHVSEPNYWYFYSGSKKREHRYSYRKNILESKFPNIFESTKTEKEIMREANYYRIWDCGNIVYSMKKED